MNNEDKVQLSDKLELADALALDSRSSMKHVIALSFIMRYYHQEYKSAMCSVRFIAEKVKLINDGVPTMALPRFNEAVKDLVEWGYIHRLAGSGTGTLASKFTLNTELARHHQQKVKLVLQAPKPSVTDGRNANTFSTFFEGEIKVENSDSSVTRCRNANQPTVTPDRNGNPPSVTDGRNEYPPIPDPSIIDKGTGIGGVIDNVPPPLASSALSLDATAVEGFERLWLAYGVRKARAKAKAEFEKLKPDAALLEDLVKAASAWAASGYCGKFGRMHLSTWLKDEHYLEDAPKPQSYQKPLIASAGQLDAIVPLKRPASELFEVVKSTDDGNSILVEGVVGDPFRVIYQHEDWKTQNEGLRQLDALAIACGLPRINDAQEIVGKRFMRKGQEFLPAPANDNDQSMEAA